MISLGWIRGLTFAVIVGISCGAQVCPAATPSPSRARAQAVQFPQYPHGVISNRLLRVSFYLPDSERGYYRGPRFDWSGMVARVDCNGHSFFSEFRPTHDPVNHDDVCGAAEEFGMTVLPSGFKEAAPGEPFIKIGIGLLERGNDPDYAFSKKYRILKPGSWTVKQTPDSVEFSQELQGPRGLAYCYTKTIRLESDTTALTLSRTLKNTGTTPIETDHYGHNFLKIDGFDADENYSLQFPFSPRLGEKARTQDAVQLSGNSLVFLRALAPDQAVWTLIEGFAKPEDNQIKVVNRKTRAAVTISTSLPLARLALYSSGGVVCPEPFVRFSLKPGEEQRWTTMYLFEAPPN